MKKLNSLSPAFVTKWINAQPLQVRQALRNYVNLGNLPLRESQNGKPSQFDSSDATMGMSY